MYVQNHFELFSLPVDVCFYSSFVAFLKAVATRKTVVSSVVFGSSVASCSSLLRVIFYGTMSDNSSFDADIQQLMSLLINTLYSNKDLPP